jgi:hypothetical protein
MKKYTKLKEEEMVSKERVSKEMVCFFNIRTKLHIDLVNKYIDKLSKNIEISKFIDISKLRIVGGNHDKSKYLDPEYTPYIYVTWSYHLKDMGLEFKCSDFIKKKMNLATNHHVKSNKHHPEYWDNSSLKIINRSDRDKPLSKIIDSTSMPLIYVSEMVCDWMGRSEEKQICPYVWAKNNINIRWKFTEEQIDFIYIILDSSWDNF